MKRMASQVAFPLFKEMLSELINNFGDEVKPQAFPLNCWDPSHEEGALQKLEYAACCSRHTVFFSKRRKNSSLCAHHAAA